jgi:hypothetical protein
MNYEPLPVVAILHPDGRSLIWINESDFDPQVHQPWSEGDRPPEPEKKRTRKKAQEPQAEEPQAEELQTDDESSQTEEGDA